ncbi:MAG: AtpZ/AtpI family protein [Dehalococcoidales bacterium]|mgnify:CR=1 FL=1|jgi:F0F1-type ATP synthase assembly protein I
MNKWRSAMRYIGVGWYIAISIAGGTLGGLWLDNKFDTKPVFIITGLFIGLIVAFYGVYRMITPLMKDVKDKENN